MNDRCLRSIIYEALKNIFQSHGRHCDICGSTKDVSLHCRNNGQLKFHRDTDDHDIVLVCKTCHGSLDCPKVTT